MKGVWIWIAAIALAFALGIGAGLVFFGSDAGGDHRDEHRPAAAAPAAAVWSCPMHPQIRQPTAGKCPICGMDLVTLAEDRDAGGGPRSVSLSAEAAALARVETAPVERRFVVRRLRLVGDVELDETRVRTVAARVPGRLERLFVDYTGVPVRQGDHLVSLFSPELETAQQELLEARRRLDEAGERSGFLRESDRRAYQGAREKLREWGMTEAQIDALEQAGEAQDRIQVDSPIGGVVIEKLVHEGDYVKTGTPLYRVAELDRVWVKIDVYEQDLPWVRYGQLVSVTGEASPGDVFTGRIAFIDPVLDPSSRTVHVRINVDNPDGRLKPGMFVRAVIESRLASYGRVLDPRLAGKWICPMHPEVVKDELGACDLCGMDLVPSESLGFVASGEAESPLVVPASAVLPTGRRAVVYVAVKGGERPSYEGREVVLGPRAGDDWIVLAGLAEGERVVVRGAFQIDSSLQLRAKPSMISEPAGRLTGGGPGVAVFRRSLEPLYDAYFECATALASDDFAAAREAADAAAGAIETVKSEGLPLDDIDAWQAIHRQVGRAVSGVREVDDIEAARTAFGDWSRATLSLERQFAHAGDAVRYEVFCPMAFDNQGAAWLQCDDVVLNPYFGASMLRCGTVRQLHPGADEGEVPGEGGR